MDVGPGGMRFCFAGRRKSTWASCGNSRAEDLKAKSKTYCHFAVATAGGFCDTVCSSTFAAMISPPPISKCVVSVSLA